MPWCPKCRLEYRDNIDKCADCGTVLVEKLENEVSLVKIMTTSDEALAQKFLEFLQYSKIYTGEKQYDLENAQYTVSVDEAEETEAKKLFHGFYITEVTNAAVMEENQPDEAGSAQEEMTFEEEEKLKQETARELQKPANVYVKREDKYKDLISTAQIFFVFGILGFVFIILNYTGLIPFINGTFSYILYIALFAACLAVGAVTWKSAKQTKAQIGEEKQLTHMIDQWLAMHVTKEELDKFYDSTLSEEINYLNQISRIKELLLREFENLDESYADQLIEDFYNKTFE